MKKKLAIVATHSVQYNSPLFRLLAKETAIEVKVFYTWSQSEKGNNYDPEFNRTIEWDLPLLEGYQYEFVENISTKPGSFHFFGINNPSLIPRIKEWKPDAILIIGWNFKSHLACLRYFKGKIPVYFRGDSTLLDEPQGFSLKKLARKYFLRYVYRQVDKAFFVGTNNKNYFLKFGLNNNQLVFAPHAIDNIRFEDNNNHYEKQAQVEKKNLGIREDDLVFVYAGKLIARKNSLLLIKAFIKANINKSHLIIIGNGNLENDLKTISKGYTNIHFIDFQNQTQMPVAYRLGSVFILPSLIETWGLAVNEAMASSRVIIASDKCGGAADLVDKNGGYLFKADCIKDLQRCLIECNDNKKELQRMGAYNSEKIKSFSYHAIVASILNQLKD